MPPKKTTKSFRPFIYLMLLGFLTIISTGIYISFLSRPVSPVLAESVRFVVPRGQAVSIIGKRLQEEGLIHNYLVFRFSVQKEGLVDKLQSGSFDLSPSMTVKEITRALTQGTQDVWVTIPEGWRREEIADSLIKQELESFDKAEFLKLTVNLEGRLFPDTYLVPREMSAKQFVGMLSTTFDKKITQGLSKDITAFKKKHGYSFDDALIMASIVERESRGYQQMRQVAGVLWNRMEIGMALQVDASLQYIKGYSKIQQSWWAPPLAADKSLNSAYNTYKYPGLPPQPIANPGIDAIKATLNPGSNSYIFYIHDNEGEIHFAKTLEQHNSNVNNYLRK